MLTRIFKWYHEAYALGYALGWDCPPGTVDPRKPFRIRGDPEVFDHFCRTCCDYSSPHWAFALCFAELITPAQAREIFDGFVAASLPGHREGQFAEPVAVLHCEPGKIIGGHRSAIHGFIGHVDLYRGRRLQPYWSNHDRRRIELYQELVNLGDFAGGPFASPKDQSRARVITATTRPRTRARVTMAEFFGHLLSHLNDDEIVDPATVAARLREANAHDLDITASHGRLTACFRCETTGGGDIPVRLVAAPGRRHSQMRRSSLLPILGPKFERTPETFELLRAAFLTEIMIAHRDLARRHGVDPRRLDRLVDWVHGLEFAEPQKTRDTAETATRIAASLPPQIGPAPSVKPLTELLAIQPLSAPEIDELPSPYPPSL